MESAALPVATGGMNVLQTLGSLTDKDIRDARSIKIRVLMEETKEPLFLLSPSAGDTDIPLCIVVENQEGIRAAENRVQQVLGKLHD